MGATADERSDLFSFGAVMYEMATGSSPFQAPSIVGVMKRVMDETPTPPHKLNPAIPRKLSDTIMALLEKRPEDRPESAASVAQVLAGVVSEFGPISPLQVPAVSHSDAKRLSGRYRTMSRRVSHLMLASAGLVLLLSGTLLGVLWSSRWKPESANQSPPMMRDFLRSCLQAIRNGLVCGFRTRTGTDRCSGRRWQCTDLGYPQPSVVKSFSAHRGIVWMIQHHPSRPLVATSGDDGMVKLWNSDNYELIPRMES